ncbi:MAG: cytochrome c oxidase assembly protein [Solibacillus sp.]
MSAHHEVDVTQVPQLLFALAFGVLFVLYIGAVMLTNRSYKKWPLYRMICWCAGVLCAVVAVVGPLANRAHMDFSMHMTGHLLLGMLAPLLIAMSAPITLLLRTLSTTYARRLTKLFRSWPSRIITDPVIATFLNIGGLWLLYTTSLYSLMHENSMVYFFVHVHVLLAGYLFTVSLIYIDPVFHRTSFVYRAVVLILALASHGILAKYIYAHPPEGVPQQQAEQGSMIMYYGGDLIDVVIIFILCLHWFKATKPRVVEQKDLEIN